MNPESSRLSASFRDPSGFLFSRDGLIYRQVNQAYRADYDLLVQSGLYDRLVKKGMLVPHREADLAPVDPDLAYKVILPEQLRFISYPYEWSFSQLKDAALLTLAIQKAALEANMSLKDASAYNIQFHQGRPVLIDTLSFEAYAEGQPWVAYRQFCQHFLAPLALMALRDVRLSQLMRVYIDGIPLDLASSLLPGSSRFNLGLSTHIHIHAGMQKKYSDSGSKGAQASPAKVSRTSMLGLIDNLESTVRGLSWKPEGTEWTDYYDSTNYTREAFERKKDWVAEFICQVKPSVVWDLGANTGVFSQLASQQGALALAFDIDPGAVEKNYLDCRQRKDTGMLPLVLDLTNPSPALGWANAERNSLAQRGPADVALALALVHHLAISNNVPLPDLAAFFSQITHWLVIEFVPKEDSQVQRLLATRKDIFDHYDRQGFEQAFSLYFNIREVKEVEGSKRTLYLMEKNAA